MSDNEIYLLIKYIKSLLWRATKLLSYMEDAWCLKVNFSNTFAYTKAVYREYTVTVRYDENLL